MSARVVQIGKFGKAQVKFPWEMALGTSYVHFNVVRMPSMHSPRVYQLNFIIKRKKGVLSPYLEPGTQKKWVFHPSADRQ
jgi:hypothetical protein